MWTFFAPNPGKSDYHLIYRDRRRSGVVEDWTEIPLTHRRTMLSSLWNPMRRDTKTLPDIVNVVASLVKHHQDQGTPDEDLGDIVMLSTPYLMLLTLVTSRVAIRQDVGQRQFALVESYGFDRSTPPDVVLCSPFHAVASARPWVGQDV